MVGAAGWVVGSGSATGVGAAGLDGSVGASEGVRACGVNVGDGLYRVGGRSYEGWGCTVAGITCSW
jgi:hypothetical protein